MIVSLGRLVDSVPALNNLMQMKFGVKTSYAIAKTARIVESEVKLYEERRVELVKKLGKPVKEGSADFEVTPENMTAFSKELAELRGIEIEIESYKITFSENDQVSPQDIFLLDWMLAE